MRWRRLRSATSSNSTTRRRPWAKSADPFVSSHLIWVQILQTHRVVGFPLNMPYTRLGQLGEAVFSTGVQNCADPAAEFALAAFVHPYPNGVFSVWIYVATLTAI